MQYSHRRLHSFSLVGLSIRLGYNARIMSSRVSRFEQHVEQLVEGSFARLFSGHLHPREIAIQLARAMEDNAVADGKDGKLTAPNQYTVTLNPADHRAILDRQPDLAKALAAELIDMARATGLQLTTMPQVMVVSDANISSHRARVEAHLSSIRQASTDSMDVSHIKPESDPLALAASLVIDSQRIIPLERIILNIGRQHDNHIILDETSVSRHHAQLRLRFGRFVLYDLDSSSGTHVNGTMVKEAILRTGDVIRLGGVNLIYTENGETSGPVKQGDTEAFPSVEPPEST